MGPEAKLVKPRFDRECRCFAVLLEGSIAGYGWLSTGPEWIGELQLEIKPRKAEGYIWNCVTLGEHRRKGIFRALLAGICDAARSTPLKRLWIGSVAIPAEKALAPVGFRPAVSFRAFTFARVHYRTVTFVDSVLGREGLHVLSVGPGVYVGSSTRRSH
ncbi:MAG: GNAT family N-acetyltransferase [Chloroflexi bacterium]|nr:MAG: GNAT family N-acetyltransferase [Chloroflexota bacterium]